MNIILFDKDVREFKKGDERYEHLKKVLHATLGSEFRGGELNGDVGVCTITALDSEKITFTFEGDKEDIDLHPLTVLLALVRPICMKRILRELVSLGVERIILTRSDLGEKSYSESSLYTTDEYKNIMINGAMQGGHTGVSQVIFASKVEEAIKSVDNNYTMLLLDNVVGAKRFKELELKNKRVCIAIGPERGWSNRERELLLDSGLIPTIMGDHILRTETASVAAVALSLEAMDII